VKTEELDVEHEEKGGIKNRWTGGWMDISMQIILCRDYLSSFRPSNGAIQEVAGVVLETELRVCGSRIHFILFIQRRFLKCLFNVQLWVCSLSPFPPSLA